MSGTLHGIGVGPGAPDLVTLRAARQIAAARVIAYPAANDGPSLARTIVADLIPTGTVEIEIPVPMRTERGPAQEAYDTGAGKMAEHLRRGTDVHVLCEGDPLFYGSFMYLAARLSADHPVAITPGVTSLSACSAEAALALVARAQVLTVLPATLSDDALAARLNATDSAAILKVGRHLPRLRALLTELGVADRAHLVIRASHGDARVCPVAEAPDSAPYFSTILIVKETDPWLTPPR